MDMDQDSHVVELRLSHRFIKAHPWVVTAVTGFLSAYYVEQPGFRLQRHYDELESGMHVWLCNVPATMKMSHLLRRLQVDLPPSRYRHTITPQGDRCQYVIDVPEEG